MLGQAGSGSVDAPIDARYTTTGTGTIFDDDGSAIVVHQNPDDLRTDSGPAGPGSSGPRIACGVITRN
jgi:Cu-Zn family superoxide dismutase